MKEETIKALDKAYKHRLYQSSLYSDEIVDELAARHPEVLHFLDFLEASRKGKRSHMPHHGKQEV